MLFLCVPPPVTRTCLQLEKIMLDYDEKSVITTYDQTSDKKEVFKGLEVKSPPLLLLQTIFNILVIVSKFRRFGDTRSTPYF